jgi:hypothetical protein
MYGSAGGKAAQSADLPDSPAKRHCACFLETCCAVSDNAFKFKRKTGELKKFSRIRMFLFTDVA